MEYIIALLSVAIVTVIVYIIQVRKWEAELAQLDREIHKLDREIHKTEITIAYIQGKRDAALEILAGGALEDEHKGLAALINELDLD